METIDPAKFVAAVTPLLERKDPTALFLLLKSNWQPEQIRQLLRGPSSDAKKMAIVALGLVGQFCCIEELALQLRDPDPVVCDMAEHALWSIWFRGGSTPEANRLVCRGSRAMNSRDYQASIQFLSAAIQIDPNFPEAYNQRAIAYYLSERYAQSIGDCNRTIKRMPYHFAPGPGWDIATPTLARMRRPSSAIARHWRFIPGSIASVNRCTNWKSTRQLDRHLRQLILT